MRKKDSLFAQRVKLVVKSIPKGKVVSYGEVARRAGNPGAARAVGTIMANNFDKSIPCHRVVKGDRNLGNYNGGGISRKKNLLENEGVKIKNGKVLRLER